MPLGTVMAKLDACSRYSIATGEEARVVGGAVCNTLLRLPVVGHERRFNVRQ